MNKKGQVTLYIVFFITTLTLITIAAVAIPMGITFNTAMYEAGESILEQSNRSIEAIQDQDIKDSISSAIQGAKENTDENINILSDIYKYSWIVILIIAGLVIFLLGRQLVEFGQGGFV